MSSKQRAILIWENNMNTFKMSKALAYLLQVATISGLAIHEIEPCGIRCRIKEGLHLNLGELWDVLGEYDPMLTNEDIYLFIPQEEEEESNIIH